MELIDNKDLFQAVFDSAPNAISVLKPIYNNTGAVADYTILLFNAHMLTLCKAIDYKGKLYTELFPMIKETDILERFAQTTTTNISANFESFCDLDEHRRWYRFTAVQQSGFLVVTTEDITESKLIQLALNQALEATEKQKRLYDSIINTTPDLVYVFDLDYRFTYANKALLDMWGKTAEAAIGKSLLENGYEPWHAEMHEREIDEAVATRKLIRGTVSFPHVELGSRVYDYIFGPVFNENGEVEAIAGTTRDITEIMHTGEKLEKSEARLKSVIDQTPAPTLVLRGDDLVISQINKNMLAMIGFGPEVVGQSLLKLMPELTDQYIWKQVEKVYKEGVNFDQPEVEVSHKRTGELQNYYYNIAYRPLIEDNEITGMIQVAIDVTEQVVARKKLELSEKRYKDLAATLEQQVEERTKELHRSNEDLQQFAHVASHDLKEPVRKIKTFTSRLEDHLEDTLDDTSKRFIDRIHVATSRMFNMIDGVLAYSTINEGTQNNEAVDLNEVLKNIETDLEVVFQKTAATIHYDKLPTIEGAPVLLYQLFYNLINNAIKFAKQDISPVIKLSSETFNEIGQDFVRIIMSDNGIGFEPDYAGRIFETFARLNPKDQFEGTGLGLALCKKIVERHGGEISASGTPNEEATFYIALPLIQKATQN